MRQQLCTFIEIFIAFQPHNPTYLVKMAEIRYSQGGIENTELARVYYEKSLSLLPSASALYGVILVRFKFYRNFYFIRFCLIYLIEINRIVYLIFPFVQIIIRILFDQNGAI